METRENSIDSDFRKYRRDILVIGVISSGAGAYGYFQVSFFNTYLEYILNSEPMEIALMVMLAAITGLFTQIIWGVISDNTRLKMGRRRPYFLLGIISGIGIFWFAFIQDFMLGLFIRIVLVEITINGYYAVQKTLISDLIPIEHRGKANGINGNLALVGMIVAVGVTLIAQGQYVSGGELNQEGHILLFGVCALLIIISSIGGFLFLKEPPVSELPPKKGFIEELKETFKLSELKKHNDYFRILLAHFVFMIGLLIIAPWIFIYIFGLELSTLELTIVAASLVPSVIVALVVLGKLTDKYGRKKIIPPVILISCIGFFMIPFVASKDLMILPLAALAIVLALIGFVGTLVPISAWEQDLLPEEKRGQFVGILNIVFTATAIPGAIVGGLVYQFFGIQWTFAFVPIFFIASIPLFMRVNETLPSAVKE